MRVQVPLKDAYRLINHGPTTLVTTCEPDGSRPNVMAAAWAMPLDLDPPRVAVVVAAGTHTRELLDRSGELVLSIPTIELLHETYSAGSVSGRDLDKWSALGLETEPATRVKPPLVKRCIAWLECRAIEGEKSALERHDLFLGEVLAAWADDQVYQGREWRFAPGDARRSIHHLARGVFLATGERLEAKKLTP